MKKLSLGICLYFWLFPAWGQSLEGRVADSATNTPLPSVTVSLSTGASTLTDENGRFRFPKIRAQQVQIRISSVGYLTALKTVDLPSLPLDIRLIKQNLLMDPVEIRATRADDRAPFTKTNLNRADIAKRNLGQDLPFLLDQTPSVVVNSDAGTGIGYTGIRIRGTDATRINVTINGIPYNDAESQGTFFVDLPDFSSSVSSIQIQRGVGTSSNGSGAFGATINVSTNEVHSDPYGQVNTSYGSFNSWKNTVMAGSGLIDQHFTIDARLSKISSDGYIDRASSDLRSYYLSGAWLSGKTSIRFNAFSGKEKTYQAWYGVSEADLASHRTINYAGTEKPGSPYDNETDNYTQSHYQLFINQKFNSRLTGNTAFFLSQGKGYYEQYKAAQAYTDYGLPDFVSGTDTLQQTDLIRQLWLDNNFYGQIFSLQYRHPATQFTLGGGWTRYEGGHYGTIIWANAGIPKNYRYYDHDALKSDVNIYGKISHDWGNGWSLFGDLQYRTVRYDINGFEDNPSLFIRQRYHFFNPKVGISLQRGQYRAYLSYSLGQKEPNRDDFEASPQQLPVAEQLHDLELGISGRPADFHWAATFYYMRYHNQLVLTGKINNVGAYTRTNIPESYRMGIELQGSAPLLSWCRLSGNISFSQNKIMDFVEYYDDYDNGGQKHIDHGTTDIALSPGIVGSASLDFHPASHLNLSLLSKYVGRQFLDNTSDKRRSLNPYFVEDCRISYSLPRFLFREIKLIGQVNNLFNAKYEPNGYTYSYQYGGELVTENYYFPMAGTNFLLALNIGL